MPQLNAKILNLTMLRTTQHGFSQRLVLPVIDQGGQLALQPDYIGLVGPYRHLVHASGQDLKKDVFFCRSATGCLELVC